MTTVLIWIIGIALLPVAICVVVLACLLLGLLVLGILAIPAKILESCVAGSIRDPLKDPPRLD